MFNLNPIALAIHQMLVKQYRDYYLYMADPSLNIHLPGMNYARKY